MHFKTDFDRYLNHIISKLTIEDCGIELGCVAERTHLFEFPIDLKSKRLSLEEEKLGEISSISEFLKNQLTFPESNTLWFKINVIDQAINDYVGIGYLKKDMNWFDFVLSYLSYDRAEESGDTMFIIIPKDFKWAINICLCQDNHSIIVESYGI